MAGGVKALKLDQALHGYADGHRQLAMSAELKPRDQKTLLSLSDISGPGARLDETGYITGYPLTESGFYALARTWPAPEMPRPGCVWTHTVLIDFADLASLSRPEELLALFRRPDTASSIASYSKRFTLTPSTESATLEIEDTWARSILNALYSRATNAIVARRPEGARADRAAVAIWGQQWPRLRRNFRFCTHSISDRSFDNNVFDLQLVSANDRTGRTRFAGSVDADSISSSHEPWIDDALADLRTPNLDGLRDFLRRLGSDISSGRKGFPPLCRLYRALGFADGETSIEEAIAILRHELRPNEAGSLRAVVVNQALADVNLLDSDAFDFLWSQKALIDKTALETRGAEFGLSLWRRDPVLLQMLTDESDVFDVVVDETIRSIDLSSLIDGLSAAPKLMAKSLDIRPEIVREPLFWSHNNDVLAFECASVNEMQGGAVEAMMKASRSDLADRAVTEFGAQTVLDQVRAQISRGDPPDPAWMQASARDPVAVARFLSGTMGIPRSMLLQLALKLSPDSVPNEYGADPWIIALQNASGTLSPDQELSLLAFLFSRALGYRSRSRVDLLRASFQNVYEAAAENLLTVDQWQLLEQRLPSSVFWFSWDRCKRLRVGAVDMFLTDGLNLDSFAWFVEDDRLLYLLAEEASTRAGGRRFLKSVRHTLKSAESAQGRRRLEIIESILD